VAVKGKHGALLAGRYRLLEQLGEGGMGSVWKAEHLVLHSHVAIKIIDPDVARLEFNLARFLREAKTLASLRSPNVVQVLDFGSDAETPYLVMEWLQGQTLGRRLTDQGRLSLRETSRILRDVCNAMALVHEQGLIHRDLKPENIFLCSVGEQRVTKVVDFGIAKSLRGDMTASMKTRTGHMLGTPSYMSPEQCRGLKDIDHRADLWALGVITYECLLGKVPFEGEVLGDLLLRICMDPLPIPSQRLNGALPPAVPAAFDAWFAKAVARDRTQRFQSALELAGALAVLSASESPAAAPEPGSATYEPLSEVSAPGWVGASATVSPEPVRSAPAAVPAPLLSSREPPNTETNTTVGLASTVRRADLRTWGLALGALVLASVLGVWSLGLERRQEPRLELEVQGLRPPFEVTPKVIHPRVPTGRRWTPTKASLTPAGSSLAPVTADVAQPSSELTPTSGALPSSAAAPSTGSAAAPAAAGVLPAFAPPITAAVAAPPPPEPDDAPGAGVIPPPGGAQHAASAAATAHAPPPAAAAPATSSPAPAPSVEAAPPPQGPAPSGHETSQREAASPPPLRGTAAPGASKRAPAPSTAAPPEIRPTR
jgi:serine/threonine-protein kinase